MIRFPLWEVHFSTPERVTNHNALLMFNVSGLTNTDLNVIVKVNGTEVARSIATMAEVETTGSLK